MFLSHQIINAISLILEKGPKTNPAKLKLDHQTTIYDLFSKLYSEAVKTQGSKKPVRFLSRYDKSATNIKESSIWSAIGQTPWSHVYSIWYHRNVDYPFRTLEVAALLGEYTLTDRGTWFAVDFKIRKQLAIFVCSAFLNQSSLTACRWKATMTRVTRPTNGRNVAITRVTRVTRPT